MALRQSPTGSEASYGTCTSYADVTDPIPTTLRNRPRLVEPMFCKNFAITDLKLMNSAFWTLHPYACDGVRNIIDASCTLVFWLTREH